MTLLGTLDRLDRLYRRTGANVPFGDPLPSHGAEMEGYFWRVTDRPGGRVLVVLCGVNRHPDGDWATVAIAAHPGGFVRSAVLDGARADRERFSVSAGDGAFQADRDGVRVELAPGVRVHLAVSDPVGWPRAWGGGGLFSMLPFLGQYWHPYLLGGRARVAAELDGESWTLDGADAYAEKNWGAGFPTRWWWGQAQGFDRPDVCVAFGGGRLTAGPLATSVTGVVVRIGAHVIRLTPPIARVTSVVADDRWEVDARTSRHHVRLVGHGRGRPHILPVPIPAERRNVHTDVEHLAGHLDLEVTGTVSYRGSSQLAGLEVGDRPDAPS